MATFFLGCTLLLAAVLVVVIVVFAMQHDKNHKLQHEARDAKNQLNTVQQHYAQMEARFRPVTNLDQEYQRVFLAVEALKQQQQVLSNQYAAQYQSLAAEFNAQRTSLAVDFQRSKAVYDRLQSEVSVLEENLDVLSCGLYRPHYNFDSALTYRAKLDLVRDSKKELIRKNEAARCTVEWSVGGSRKEGQRMQKQLSKLMLRAFNGECDAALANVDWKNVTKMEERVRRAFDAVNQLGTVVQVSIEPRYLDLSFQELRLAFEYAEKKRAELEEQRRIKEQMREEERAQRELQRAKDDALAEERRYEKALIKARQEMNKAKGAELLALNEQVAALQQQLSEAHAKRERAVSMAELTRCGYIYVISNIGSFGERVYKIGMTRRLDPMDRIWELGDASVPFDFDVHAMIYTENAPDLERAIHQHFHERRVNMVNCRKEFFEVTIEEVESFLNARGLELELTKLAEAREFRETRAMRTKGQSGPDCVVEELAQQLA